MDALSTGIVFFHPRVFQDGSNFLSVSLVVFSPEETSFERTVLLLFPVNSFSLNRQHKL